MDEKSGTTTGLPSLDDVSQLRLLMLRLEAVPSGAAFSTSLGIPISVEHDFRKLQLIETCIQNLLPYRSHIQLHRDAFDATLVHVRLTPRIDNRLADSAKQTPSAQWLRIREWLARCGHRRAGGWFTLKWRGVKRRVPLSIVACTRVPEILDGRIPTMSHQTRIVVDYAVSFVHESGARYTVPIGTVFEIGSRLLPSTRACETTTVSATSAVAPQRKQQHLEHNNPVVLCQKCCLPAVFAIHNAHTYCTICMTNEHAAGANTEESTSASNVDLTHHAPLDVVRTASMTDADEMPKSVPTCVLYGGWLDPVIPREEITQPGGLQLFASINQHWNLHGVQCVMNLPDWLETESLNQVAMHHAQYLYCFRIWLPRVVSLLCLDFLTF